MMAPWEFILGGKSHVKAVMEEGALRLVSEDSESTPLGKAWATLHMVSVELLLLQIAAWDVLQSLKSAAPFGTMSALIATRALLEWGKIGSNML